MKKVKDFDSQEYIQKLPIDLLLLIFTKLIGFEQHYTLSDIKFVCQCSIVSKRFNSIIPLLPSLSITSYRRKQILATFLKIIEKFKHIRCLYIEPGYGPFKSRKYFKWKATCVPSTTTYYIVGISYNSIKKYSSTKHKHLVSNNSVSENFARNRYSSTENYVYCMVGIHEIILGQIQNHEMLQYVVITDVKKYGSFVLDKVQLAELRNSLCTSIYNGGKNYIKNYFVKHLHLPQSDLLLRGLSCIILNVGKHAANDDDIIRAVDAMDLLDDETIFPEVLVSLFGKHQGYNDLY